ncbi:hypothetical protein SEA_C3PO_87 [Corynebacterium phage C3PO]|uniref:Uncharacterized protein n=2 Tax=Corynebacterium virus C3PO TaxID=2560393 RepID=A0A3G3LWQ8_9CAUD|nr:hypothetical protein FDJ10_gp56 [Corynebacterium phage C3PO]ATW58495.1 hypothetical protein SEA_C3PO_87 [Corynebacterium phage C3PO]AYQ98384.1 hypothetical protein CRUELLA_88 [Corynebacterium phage Cruella]
MPDFDSFHTENDVVDTSTNLAYLDYLNR